MVTQLLYLVTYSRMKSATGSNVYCILFLLLMMVTQIMSLRESGCGKVPPFTNGNGGELTWNGRTFWLHIPTGYERTTPSKLVMLFHGWGYSGREWGQGSGSGAVSATPACNNNNYIMISPTGLTDRRFSGNCNNGGGYCSWNGFGSTKSPGPDGTTCNLNNQPYDYCYTETCGSCVDKCWWTNCADDVQFVVDLFKYVSDTLVCVDPSNVFAGGESNGGMFVWELGMDSRSAALFSALSPTIGLPHRGFIKPPAKTPLPILVSSGNSDRTVPPGNNNDQYTESSDGFYYVTARAATVVWNEAHGEPTSGSPSTYRTSYDGTQGLACTTFDRDPDNGKVVDCRQNGGHQVKSYIPELMIEFFNKNAQCFSSSLDGCLAQCPVEGGCNCQSLCVDKKQIKGVKTGVKNSPVGTVIAGVIGGIMGVILLISLVMVYCRKDKRRYSSMKA